MLFDAGEFQGTVIILETCCLLFLSVCLVAPGYFSTVLLYIVLSCNPIMLCRVANKSSPLLQFVDPILLSYLSSYTSDLEGEKGWRKMRAEVQRNMGWILQTGALEDTALCLLETLLGVIYWSISWDLNQIDVRVWVGQWMGTPDTGQASWIHHYLNATLLWDVLFIMYNTLG